MRHPDHRFEWTRAEFARLGRRASPSGTATRCAYRAGRRRRPRGRPADPAGRLHAEEARPRMTDAAADPASSCLVVARRCLRVREVDVRAQALRPLRGGVERLLPRPGRPTTRTTRAPRGRLRRAGLHRRQAARRRPADRGRRDQRAAATPGASSSTSRRRTTCCRSRSCSTSPTASASPATPSGPTATSGRGSSAGSATSCAGRCGGLRPRGLPHGARAARRRGGRRRPRSSASGCSTTAATSTGPFDVIGDVHGCRSELETLLDRARLRARARRPRPCRRRRTSGRPHGRVPRRPRRPRPGHPRRAAPRHGHGRRPATRCASPATTRTSWSGRCAAAR